MSGETGLLAVLWRGNKLDLWWMGIEERRKGLDNDS
jgi:hypothetical protein